MTICLESGDGSLTASHPLHHETYHSVDGAELESLWLFVEASGFKQGLTRSSERVRVVDLGLGLGLNALNGIEAWFDHPCPPNLQIVSIESDEALVKDLFQNPQAEWKAKWPERRINFLKQVREARFSGEDCFEAYLKHGVSTSSCHWLILPGLMQEVCRNESLGLFDFFWHDAFSPQTTPECWTAEFFTTLRKRSKPGAILVTYSVAGEVRRNLNVGSWDWEKIPTPMRKKNWLKARASQVEN